MKIKSIFYKGKRETIFFRVDDLAQNLLDMRKPLHDIPVNEILDFFHALGNKIKQDKDLAKKARMSFVDLADFLDKRNLAKNLDLSLRGEREYLDKFIRPDGFDFYLHAKPRGLVVEWLAGNIPFLGIYSMSEILVTKNVLLTKAPHKNYETLLDLLEIALSLASERNTWKTIVDSICVVLVPREDTEAHRALSMIADVRVVWGSEESVKSILALDKNYWTEDIVYGPKYSYAIIDKHMLADDARRIASALAVDIANFDQYACSSPHTVFMEHDCSIKPLEFGNMLAVELDRVSRLLLPKETPDPSTIMRIATIRAMYSSSNGRVLVPKGNATDWTVIISEEQGPAPAICSRTIFIKTIKSISDLSDLNNRGIQSIGVSPTMIKNLDQISNLTIYGGDRIPTLGKMSSFNSPWDGVFAMDRLVRWVRYN